MQYLHGFLCILLFISGFFVSASTNPVESVLFLILTFCNAAAILFIFNSEFLGLLFIIIYVGAIAVLFLFVIMMLNVKIQDSSILSSNFSRNNMAIRLFFLYFLGLLTLLFIKKAFYSGELLIFTEPSEFFYVFDSLNNIDVLGQVLYNYFLVCFLLAGLILLVALIGSIVLTLKFNSLQKSQIVFRQLSRTDNFLSFFK